MARKILIALVATAVLGVADMANAQEEVVIQEEDRVVYRERTIVDFNDMTLEGELSRPDGAYMMNLQRASFSTLINLRQNFLPELEKSVDNL